MPRELLFIVCVLAALPVDSLSAQSTFVVSVHLKETADANDAIVRVGDIAEVESGDRDLASRISALDITKFAANRNTRVVRQAEVRFRILLSGVSSDQVRVMGADTVKIHRRARMSFEDSLTQKFHQHIATVRNVPLEQIRVRLIQPISKHISDQMKTGNTRVVLLSDSLNSLGSLRPRFALYIDDRLTNTFTASVDVQQRVNVSIAKQALPRNHQLTEQDIMTQQRWTNRERETQAVPRLIGQTTRTTVRAGQLIEATHISRQPSRTESVIKPRDLVRIAVHIGNVTVIVTDGEALDRGSIGDVIRVRNPRSSQVLRGRVASAGSVVVR